MTNKEKAQKVILDNINPWDMSKIKVYHAMEAIRIAAIPDETEDWKCYAQDKICEFLLLPYDWNGNKAFPFNPKLIANALKVISQLYHLPKPLIYPTARQSVQLEYYDNNQKNKYLELEIYENFITGYQEPESITIDNISIPEIQEWIKSYYNITV